VNEQYLPEVIWAGVLPDRIVPALKRWVAMADMSRDEETITSRQAGGRC